MLRHVVIFRWKPDTTGAQVEAITEALRALPAQIPDLRGYQVGPDLGLVEGNGDYAVVADVDDVAGLTAYREHPVHRAALDDLITPAVESRIAVQYEV